MSDCSFVYVYLSNNKYWSQYFVCCIFVSSLEYFQIVFFIYYNFCKQNLIVANLIFYYTNNYTKYNKICHFKLEHTIIDKDIDTLNYILFI